LAAYVPAYAYAYGGWHFLQLCNLSLLLSCLGALMRNRLLLSAQALGAPVIGLLWIADLAHLAATGRYWHAGTAYLWDERIPEIARMLSVYHLVLPMVLIFALRRFGYDRRALLLQTAISCAAFAVSWWWLRDVENLNYVNAWPGGRVLFADTPGAHAFVTWSLLCAVVYVPTHWLWRRWCSSPREMPLWHDTSPPSRRDGKGDASA
jgi:hypothetical protein